MTAKKRWHVEFDVEQWHGRDWHADAASDPTYIELELDQYYIQIPLDATFTELAPALEDGYYVSASAGRLYRRSGAEAHVWATRTGLAFAWHKQADIDFDQLTYLGPIQEGDR